MSQFFFDASAIVKRYKTEVGTAWIDALTNPTTGHTIILSEITLAEVAAALAAAHRAPGGGSQKKRDKILARFLKDCKMEYRLIAVNRSIIDRAVSLTQNYRLRGYDAVQLATALVTNETLVATNLSPLTFITADVDLAAAAHTERLNTENPNHHQKT